MIRRTLSLTLAFCLLAVGVALVPSAALAGGDPEPMKVSQNLPKAGDAPRVIGILRTTDKAQTNRYVPATFELKHANPFVVGWFLRMSIQAEAGMIATYANPETDFNSGLILVNVPEYQLEKIGEYIKNLDRPKITVSSGSKWAYVSLKHRSVLDTDMIPSVLLQYATNDTTIIPDVKTNSFLVTSAPSGVNAVLTAAVDYDVPTAQVSVSAKVYEIEVANDQALGLDFVAWKNGPGQELFSLYGFNYRSKTQPAIDTNTNLNRSHGYGSSYSVDYPSEFFDFLTIKGKGRVMTEAKVSVMDGSAAVIRVQDEILYYPVMTNANGARVVAPAETAAGATVTPLMQRVGDVAGFITSAAETERAAERGDYMNIRAGVVLGVTPVIARNNIDLDIVVTINDFMGWDASGIPLVNTRAIDTQVRSVNGQEVVLGRMNRSRQVQSKKGVPFLSKLPIIGYIFGGEITGKKNTTVVMAVTPTIVEEGGMTAEDKATVSMVMGDEESALPCGTYFFEQYLLDN